MNFSQQDGIAKLGSLGAKMLSTFMKHLAAFLIICVAVVGYFWLKISDHSPLNSCEPTDVVRIKLDGQEYHIPVEWQPLISQRLSDGADFPTRFSYQDLQGNYTGQGWWLYCQDFANAVDEYRNVNFKPADIERITPQFLSKHPEYKYLQGLTYIGIFASPQDPLTVSKPKLTKTGTAFDSMYWRYEAPNGLSYFFSRNWRHEGAEVIARERVSSGYSVTADVSTGTELRATVLVPTQSSARLSRSIPPQDWPAMLAEVTDLMRSFEVPPNPAVKVETTAE
ncbi:hypothetical protein J7481_10960 [Labrenzia sp. R4_2]|uniref:hypothetical protein n=1 Tax=Labrenzia sp. R4_2 TaxID=2821107 RepID=UPI001ADA3B50|nr:hypothetical protein [Labrenzia sp. R4_2]MBO9420016.1 hypothetical protein [Labrenzia sp. R4_2]